jgi:hypothetical protein
MPVQPWYASNNSMRLPEPVREVGDGSAASAADFYRRLMTADAPEGDVITRLVDTVLGA